jgi:hypothetical protein
VLAEDVFIANQSGAPEYNKRVYFLQENVLVGSAGSKGGNPKNVELRQEILRPATLGRLRVKLEESDIPQVALSYKKYLLLKSQVQSQDSKMAVE